MFHLVWPCEVCNPNFKFKLHKKIQSGDLIIFRIKNTNRIIFMEDHSSIGPDRSLSKQTSKWSL